MAKSRAFIHLCFFANLIAVSLNMFLANNIPKIDPSHKPIWHDKDAIVMASQADLYAFIRAKPEPKQNPIDGMSIACVIVNTMKSVRGPKNLCSPSQAKNASAIYSILSGL